MSARTELSDVTWPAAGLPPAAKGGAALELVNQRTDEAVARDVEVATSRRARRKGLLGRRTFEAPAALVLAPCTAIHTMFMRFPIDVVFVDEDGCAVRVVPDLEPWRIAVAPFAHAAIELPAGRLRERPVTVGDRLYLLESDGARIGLSAGDLRERVC